MKGWNKESCFQIVVGFLSHCWTRSRPGKWNGPSMILFGEEISYCHDFPSNKCCEYDDVWIYYTHNSQMFLMTNCQRSPQIDKVEFFTKVAAQKTCISTFKLSNMSLRYFEVFNNEYLFLWLSVIRVRLDASVPLSSSCEGDFWEIIYSYLANQYIEAAVW